MNSILLVIALFFSSLVNADVVRAEILDRNSVVLAHSNVNSKRYYPFGFETAHLLGYVLPSSTGKIGLEKQYNDMLEKGKALETTIDIELQRYLYEILADVSGATIVMDANSGEILAAGSFPSYDANIFIEGMKKNEYLKLLNDYRKPFTNKLINALYPPGSTIKTGLGLLYATSDINDSFNCLSSLPIGKQVFRCSNIDGHGNTNIQKAIRENCDDYFYKGSLIIGNKKMAEGLNRYGLGHQTGIDLPNEFYGVIPSAKWKKEKYHQAWYIGETLNTSIGQGDFLVTPIQIAKFTALMATGKLVTPHFSKSLNPLVKNVLNQNEVEKLPLIQKAMYEVCNHPKGSATKYLNTSIELAGQIGVAQVIGNKEESSNRSHSWLTTYGPYKYPQYIVTVLLEHEGNNGIATGDIVSKIYNKLLELDYVK